MKTLEPIITKWGTPRSLSMLGWALNEQESIGIYIERAEAFLRTLADEFELIVIDDGSTDRTAEIIEKYRESRPWLHLHRNERNRGSGYNTKKAVSLARKDYLFWQTVDWAYDITKMRECLAYLREFDVLQGVRYKTFSLSGPFAGRSDTPLKGMISFVNYLLVRLLFRLPIHDYQNVTVYPRKLIQSVTLESESAFTNPECLLKVWWKGATIKEFPVPFLKRQRGTGKGTRPKVIIRSVCDILYWWFRWIVLGRRSDKKTGHVSCWNES